MKSTLIKYRNLFKNFLSRFSLFAEIITSTQLYCHVDFVSYYNILFAFVTVITCWRLAVDNSGDLLLRPVVHWNGIRPSKSSPVYGRIRPTDPMTCKGIATSLLHTTYSAECYRTRPSDGRIQFKWDQSYVFVRKPRT
jgi:hypothetical protein